MNKKEITFLSSRGRGLSNDLSLVKNHLITLGKENLSLRYYLNNELHKNPLAAHGYRRAKKSFMEGTTNVICVDASLSSKMNNLSQDGKRILLAVPYEYQFKNELQIEEKGKDFNLNTLAQFTHIIAGSPFTASLLKKAYRLEDKVLVEEVSLPFAWDTIQEGSRQKVQHTIFSYFPQAEGKNILSLIVYGDEEKKRKDWENFDIKGFTKSLGEDWFVFTNSDYLVENAFAMSNRYKDCFGYISRMLPIPDLIYLTDVLVTNNGRLASAFSIQDKPVYVCHYNANNFEKYVKYKYPDMYFEDTKKLLEHSFVVDELTQQQRVFCSEMSYRPVENPFDKITEILDK